MLVHHHISKSTSNANLALVSRRNSDSPLWGRVKSVEEQYERLGKLNARRKKRGKIQEKKKKKNNKTTTAAAKLFHPVIS